MAGRDVEWSQVQGIVLSGYRAKPITRYFLLTIVNPNGARAWLRGLLERPDREPKKKYSPYISFGYDGCANGGSLNIAFTLAGLIKLELPQDAIDTFPWDFRDGIASPLRQRILGDFGCNTPSKWKWGGCDPDLHAIVMMHVADEDELTRCTKALQRRWQKEGAFIQRHELPDGDAHEREHFGFADGLSQPAIASSLRAEKLREQGDLDAIVQPGEFILGYVNERGQLPVSPSIPLVPDLWPSRPLPIIARADRSLSGFPRNTRFPRLDFGRNGTFLVFRQLEQHALRFAELIERGAEALATDADFRRLFAAKIIGRWDDGTSLTLAPSHPPPEGSNLQQVNKFGYAAEDRYGLRCPIGSHVRRANPRDSLGDDPADANGRTKRHRLLRRGRTYGSIPRWVAWDNKKKGDDGKERGLHFIALNASIESQFEFIQQTWMNTPFFGGLTRDLDPLVGMPDVGEGSHQFTVQDTPVNRRVRWQDPLVTVRGGAYFFLPGRAALGFLTNEG